VGGANNQLNCIDVNATGAKTEQPIAAQYFWAIC